MGHNNTEKDKGPGFKPSPLRPNIARRDQDSRAKPAQARGRLAGKDNMRLWNESLLKRSIGSAFQTSRRPRGKTVRRRFAARVFRRCAARAREKDFPSTGPQGVFTRDRRGLSGRLRPLPRALSV